jgi:hypothetical protein
MYAAWLVAALATAMADACSTDPICVGMTTQAVDAVAGEHVAFFAVGPRLVGIGGYSGTDCLGGVKEWGILLDTDDCMTSCDVHYRPFAATPPWLDALRDAFGPRPAPPPAPGLDSV